MCLARRKKCGGGLELRLRKTGFPEELRRERSLDPEPAPLLLERLFMAPVAAAPKE